MSANSAPSGASARRRSFHTGGKPPDRKRSPTKLGFDELEPAAGGSAPGCPPEEAASPQTLAPDLYRRQFSQQEWEYLENLPDGSLAEEIKMMRVLSLRLVQQGLQADNPGDEIRYYSEATRIMARLPALLKAEKALQSSRDDVTQAMIEAINTVLEEIEAEKAQQLELPFEQSDGG